MNASFLLRLKAFLIDYLFILIYIVLLILVNVFLFPSLQQFFTGSVVTAQLAGFLVITLPVSLYFIISDSVLSGQSFGKRKVGIKVVTQNGEPLSIMHAVFRTMLKFSPWELSHYLVYRLVYLEGDVPFQYTLIGGIVYALMFAYILTAIFTKKKQSLYDLIVKTEVIKIKKKA